jgi:hypothetical protein
MEWEQVYFYLLCHQVSPRGSGLGPKFFNLIIDKLLERVKSSNRGCWLILLVLLHMQTICFNMGETVAIDVKYLLRIQR